MNRSRMARMIMPESTSKPNGLERGGGALPRPLFCAPAGTLAQSDIGAVVLEKPEREADEGVLLERQMTGDIVGDALGRGGSRARHGRRTAGLAFGQRIAIDLARVARMEVEARAAVGLRHHRVRARAMDGDTLVEGVERQRGDRLERLGHRRAEE